MGTKVDPFAFLDDPGEDVFLQDEAKIVEASPTGTHRPHRFFVLRKAEKPRLGSPKQVAID